MIKETFTGVLTFALLIGGTVAIGSALLGLDVKSTPAPQVAMVTMPTVTILAHRADVLVAKADSATKTAE